LEQKFLQCQQEDQSDTPEQEADYQDLTETSLIIVVVAAQATMWKLRIAHQTLVDRNVMCV
jgi:hypothetical protein